MVLAGAHLHHVGEPRHRDGAGDATWSLSDAVQPSDRTIVLFEPSGVEGSRWKATRGGITAVAVDAVVPAMPPTWSEDAAKQCL